MILKCGGLILMEIIIEAKNINLTKELREFIQSEMNSLEKFAKRIFGEKYYDGFFGKGRPRAEAHFEVSKQKGFYYAECNLNFPKKLIRSESLKKNLKSAIIEVKDELQREIKEYKEKFIAKGKRAQRAFKKDLKLSPLARFYRKGRIREEGR
jgi:ribosomal subunit interface protein